MNCRMSNWMEDLWTTIKDTDIRQIKIPGTHDSGAFSILNTTGVQDQELDIKGQLNAGVRFLDIRITKSIWYNGYTMFHETYPMDDSQDFLKAMNQVADFVNTHPYEFVIVKLLIKDGDPIDLPITILNETIGPFLLTYTDFLNPHLTPAMLKDSCCRVILITENNYSTDPHYFPKLGSIISSWNGDQQDGSLTPLEQASIARHYIEANLLSREFLLFGYSDAYIYGLDNRTQEVWLHNTKLPNWLNDWSQSYPQLNSLNIIGIDFAGIDTIVPAIINLNTIVLPKPTAITKNEFQYALQLDFDGDGKKDLLLYSPGEGHVCILMSNEDGTLTEKYDSTNGIGGYDLASPADRILVFDFDGDGKDDLLLYRPGRGAVFVLKSNGDGTFTTVYTQGDGGHGIGGYDLTSPADRILVFDYNGDGKDDLLLYRPGRGAVFVLKSNGDGTFTTVYAQGDGGHGIGGYDLASPADQILVFDYDGDGKDDLLLYRPGRGAVFALKSNGDGTFTTVCAQGDGGHGIGGYDLASPVDQILVFDYDGDGKDDLLLYRPGHGAAFVVKSNGDGTFTAVYAQGDSGHGIGGYDLSSPNDRILSLGHDKKHAQNLGNRTYMEKLLVYRIGVNAIYIERSKGDGTFSLV